MRYSLKFYLDSKSNDEGHIIWLYFRSGLSTAYLHTGKRIKKEFWDSVKQCVKKTFRMSKTYNDYLTMFRLTIDDELTKYLTANPLADAGETKQMLTQLLSPKAGNCLSNAVEEYIKAKSLTVTPKTIAKFRRVVELYKEASDDPKLNKPVNSVGKQALENYCSYLYATDHATRTANKYSGFLLEFLYWCENSGYKIHENVRSFKRPKTKESDEVALTYQEFVQLRDTEFTSEKLCEIKDLFLFQIYCGQGVADFLKFKIADCRNAEGVLVWNLRRQKTQKPLLIPLIDPAVEILKKYNNKLPFISSQKYNEHLKKLCDFAGINTLITVSRYVGNRVETKTIPKFELISSHTARRTFVTIASHLGLSDAMISQITGHGSGAMIRVYRKKDTATLASEMNKVFKNNKTP